MTAVCDCGHRESDHALEGGSCLEGHDGAAYCGQFRHHHDHVRLTVVPLTIRAAAAFVTEHHRHNKPPRGHKFSIGVCDEAGVLHGVAMVGRPIARHFDDGLTAEVNRTCTDGTPNANSALYGAAWRITSAMGYRRLVTYTQAGESGASLTAAGWIKVRDLPARKGWAASSVALRAMRDPVGSGSVQRALWEKSTPVDEAS